MAQSPDDFSPKTRRALAFRAGHKCSFTGCRISTSGPSEESPESYFCVGIAAHIYGARPGSARYRSDMTSLERAHISNGIWVCTLHSKLIDDDEETYTADVVRRMKAKHEEYCKNPLNVVSTSILKTHLVALGPDLIFTAELVSMRLSELKLRVEHFLKGDFSVLSRFGERFDKSPLDDRFVLLNVLNEGRELECAPVCWKEGGVYFVSLQVKEAAPRMNVRHLPSDWKLDSEWDLHTVDGTVATVSGLDALAQKLMIGLSLPRAELFPSFQVGSRLAEFYCHFHDHPMLLELIKLEVIRMACIPYHSDTRPTTSDTLLLSVRQVRNVTLVAPPDEKHRALFLFQLDVEGVGEWQCEIPVFILPRNIPRDRSASNALS